MMKFTDTDLVMYADGTLNEERARLLLQASAHDKELAEALLALDASCLPYKAAHSQHSLLTAPPALQEKIAEMVSSATNSDKSIKNTASLRSEQLGKPKTDAKWFHWPKGLSAAACIGLCVGAGYWLGSAAPLPHTLTTKSEQSANTGLSEQMAWVERVADYQSLYVANTVKDLSPNQVDATQLLNAIEQRSGMRTGIPDLSEQGYEFVRAQELGYMDNPLVQLVYNKPGALPLALCYTPSNDVSETKLTLTDYHGLNTASWTDRGQRYVIVGSEGTEELQKLYTSIIQVL